MTKWMTPDKEGHLRSMRSNLPKGTKPELLLMAALEATGSGGFERNTHNLPGKPDIVYREEGLAVFMHGCFWHSCPTCYPGGYMGRKVGGKNAEMWSAKWVANHHRDESNMKRLEDGGWAIYVCWECQIKTADGLLAACEAVGRLLQYAREA